MRRKVSELEGCLLDAAVAMAEGDALPDFWRDPDDGTCWLRPGREIWHPSGRWGQGGLIIEREGISVVCVQNLVNRMWWQATAGIPDGAEGGHFLLASASLPLVAAMRAYVGSKFGEEVELPD